MLKKKIGNLYFLNRFMFVIIMVERDVNKMSMEFLYFPQDKTEYIPAFIMLVIFMIGALATMYLFYRKSKKDEQYFDEKYNINQQNHQDETELKNE